MHEHTVLLTMVTRDIPYVDPQERVNVRGLKHNMWQVTADSGFAEDPDVTDLLADLEVGGEGFDYEETTLFPGRENLIATGKPGMGIWREKLFSRVSRNALQATSFFNVPSARVVEVGTQVEL